MYCWIKMINRQKFLGYTSCALDSPQVSTLTLVNTHTAIYYLLLSERPTDWCTVVCHVKQLKELEKTLNELRQHAGKPAVRSASSYGGLVFVLLLTI